MYFPLLYRREKPLLQIKIELIKLENTVRLQTVREHEVKGQNIPDYFQNHLS